MGVSLCRLCVSNVFGERAGFDMDANHILPQGVLAAITLIRHVVGVGVSKACVGCEVGLPLCFMAVTALSEVEGALQLLK